jgi:hypothetical protein
MRDLFRHILYGSFVLVILVTVWLVALVRSAEDGLHTYWSPPGGTVVDFTDEPATGGWTDGRDEAEGPITSTAEPGEL